MALFTVLDIFGTGGTEKLHSSNFNSVELLSVHQSSSSALRCQATTPPVLAMSPPQRTAPWQCCGELQMKLSIDAESACAAHVLDAMSHSADTDFNEAKQTQKHLIKKAHRKYCAMSATMKNNG